MHVTPTRAAESFGVGLAPARPSADRTVLIAKSERFYRATLQSAVQMLLPEAQIDRVARVAEARARTAVRRYDVIITGVMLLDGDVLDWLAGILAAEDPPRVLVVTARRETRYLMALHDLQAHGVFDSQAHGPEEFCEALRMILAGGMFWSASIRTFARADGRSGAELLSRLTATERLVLAVIGDGSDDNEAAERLQMSAGAIRSHRKRLYAKLGINHRGQLMKLAMRHGFVHLAGDQIVQPGLGLLMAARQAQRTRAV